MYPYPYVKRTFSHFHSHPPPSPPPHTAAAAQRLKSLGLCKSRGVIKRKNKRGRNVGNILLLLSLSHGLDNTTRSSLLHDPELRDHDPELTTSRPGAHDFTTVTSRTLFLVLSSSLFSKCPSAQSINTLCAHSFIACCVSFYH